MVKSPLRYPGAKKKVLNRFTFFWDIEHEEYRDVFVGGGSTFFGKPLSSKNWINDIDEEVAALYYAMKNHSKELCELVQLIKPTVSFWKEIKSANMSSVVDKGLRTLFLNRTTFSGILKGNPIGGIEQKSKYKIDCRWNPDVLCKQIEECSIKLKGVKISSVDFEKVIRKSGKKVLLYLDPPYYYKGNSLYRHGMSIADHERLAKCLKRTSHEFFITYDDCEEIRKLYSDWAHLYTASWFYSSSNKERKMGKELFISSKEIIIDNELFNKI